MRAVICAGLGLLAVACADRAETYVAPPSDAAIVERWEAKKSDYELVLRTMTIEPRIERIEQTGERATLVLPVGADPGRVRSVVRIMEEEGMLYASAGADRTIDLTVFENLGPKGYQSRMVTYRPGQVAADKLVGDAGATVIAEPGVAWRDLGGGWYLRASGWPPEAPEAERPLAVD